MFTSVENNYNQHIEASIYHWNITTFAFLLFSRYEPILGNEQLHNGSTRITVKNDMMTAVNGCRDGFPCMEIFPNDRALSYVTYFFTVFGSSQGQAILGVKAGPFYFMIS